MRAGIGFDVHAFDPARPLVLGGVRIPDAPGLAGHSDADVLCHAIADALLGAASLGDIGEHFPDTDERWKDASSLDILRDVMSKVAVRGYAIGSIDATVLIEAPKIAPYKDEMRTLISRALEVGADLVNIKASTAEGLGPVGRGEGAACMAVALLEDA
jgi:2-C-methyl-D-erythritol 2,4-cyclodiphosphate synthase